MDNIQLFQFNTAYLIVLLLLAAGFAMDLVSILRCLKKGGSELQDYATYFIKYLKIAINFLLAVFCIYVTFFCGYDIITSAVHGILGLLLLGDAVFSLYIKLRYKGAKK